MQRQGNLGASGHLLSGRRAVQARRAKGDAVVGPNHVLQATRNSGASLAVADA
jgi:hypothetical protein